MAFWRSKKAESATDQADPSSPPTEQPAADSTPNQPPVESESSGGVFAKMRGALTKTRQTLKTDIRDLFKSEGRLVDDDFLDELFAR